MADITDVINWQQGQYKQKSRLLPQLAETGVTSFFKGMEAGPKERASKLDEQIKMYDLAIKMMEAAQREKDLERYNMELRKDFNNKLGITEKDKTAGIMTEAGKVITSMNDNESRVGRLINGGMPDKYKKEFELTSKGTKVKYTERNTEMEKAKLAAEKGKAEWYTTGRHMEAERNRQLKKQLVVIGKSQKFKESDYLNIVKQAKNNAINQMETMYGKYASYMFEPAELNAMIEEIENEELEKILSNIKKVKTGDMEKQKEKTEQFKSPDKLNSESQKMIKVKIKATGQTGSLPEEEFDPDIYEIIE